MKADKQTTPKIETPRKYERIYEDSDSKFIWKYDLDKFANGPISVECHWKAHYLKSLELKTKRGR
jgi:hypothetical protein